MNSPSRRWPPDPQCWGLPCPAGVVSETMGSRANTAPRRALHSSDSRACASRHPSLSTSSGGRFHCPARGRVSGPRMAGRGACRFQRCGEPWRGRHVGEWPARGAMWRTWLRRRREAPRGPVPSGSSEARLGSHARILGKQRITRDVLTVRQRLWGAGFNPREGGCGPPLSA